MDRATRIANLKKLQLPGTVGQSQQRKTRHNVKTKGLGTISHHFTPNENAVLGPEAEASTSAHLTAADNADAIEFANKCTPAKAKTDCAKRMKIDAFIFKTPQVALPKSQTLATPEDDFELPTKLAKQAPSKTYRSKLNLSPKTKKLSKKKKQSTLKSAFLRNEQLFAEIAAQHCAADNFDSDDIQLAIAISKSEAESNGIVDVDDNDVVVDGVAASLDDNEKAESIRQKLEKYGFRTAEHQDYNAFAAAFMPQSKARRPKSKWANKFTPLTLRDQQLQNKKLQQKIETILKQQFRTRPLTTQEQDCPNRALRSSLLRQCDKDIKKKLLNLSENPQSENVMYFVEELFEINKLPPGHLLKDWNAIQGRDSTPEKSYLKNEMDAKLQNIYAELEEYFTSLKKNDLPNESILGKEQTVGETKEIKEKPEENKTQFQNIANDMACSEKNIINNILSDGNMRKISPVKLLCNDRHTETSKSSEVSLMSTDTSESNPIFKLLPLVNDLDLMQVSGTSINVQQTELQSQKANIDQQEICSDPLRENANLKPLNNAESQAHHSEQVSTVSTDLLDTSSCSLDIENIAMLDKNECKTTANKNVCSLQEQRKKIPITALKLLSDVSSYDFNVSQISSTLANSFNAITAQSRSPSPDLFPDFEIDVEMEDVDNNLKQSNCAVDVKEKKSSESFESIEGVTTYELFSSDEVKNLSSLVNRNIKDSNIIDFVQECKRETQQNQSKSQVEIDLTADSPLQDEDGGGAVFKTNNTKDSFSFDEELVDTHKTEANNENDFVLLDFEMDEMKTSSFNIRGSSQLDTCCHRKTPAADFKFASKEMKLLTKTTSKILHQADDTVFMNLCNKYLGKSSSQPKPKTNEYDLKTSFTQVQPHKVSLKSAQMGRKLSTGNSFESNIPEISFTAIQPRLVSPKSEQMGRNISSLKSLSFESKRPEKIRSTQIQPQMVSPKSGQLGLNIITGKSLSFECKTPEDHVVNFQLSKSLSFNESNISIDLTQNDDDDDPKAAEVDDEYLVLSDDEINYSIWNANKTGYLDKVQRGSDNEDDSGFEINNYKKLKKSLSSQLKGMSAESLIEIEHELDNDRYAELDSNSFKKSLRSTSSSFEEVSPPKRVFHNSITSEYTSNNLQLDRSHFGILDGYSQPIDFASTTELGDFSFLDPPETSAQMKRYSSGSKTHHQLNKLVSNLDVQNSDPVVIDDFEDYIFNTELNQSNNTTDTTLPQGLDQLMTAEISYKYTPSTHSSQEKESFHLDSHNMREINDNLHTSAGNRKPETVCDKYEITIKDRTYAIRNNNVPKPDYTLYTEAALLKELYEYGIKPLKRKQAIKILEYIYTQTHPLIVDEPTANEKSNQYLQNCNDLDVASTSKPSRIISFSSQDSLRLSQKCSVTQKSSIKPSEETHHISNKLNLQDGSGMEMLCNSEDVRAELDGEQYILQTNVTKKTPQPLMPLHIAWFNLLCCNPKLHERILMYEPIDLQEIYLFLKNLGYRYDPKDLKQFFDNRCIIFRYDLAAAGGKITNRHVRGRNKK